MASKTASLMLAAAKTAARLELERAAKTQAEEKEKKEEESRAGGDRRSVSRSASYSRSERNRDRDRDRSRSRDRGRRRDSRSRSRSRDKDRDRDRDRDRRRNRGDSRDRSRSRDRDRRRRRDDSRSRDRDRRRGRGDSEEDDRRSSRRGRRSSSRDRSRDRDGSRGRDGKPPASAAPVPGKPATLTEIMAANPGISILDATKHLASFNAAAASGLPRALSMVDHIRISSGGMDAMPDSVAAALGYPPSASFAPSSAPAPGANVTTASGVPVGAGVRHQLHLSNIPLNVSAADLGALVNAALLMTGAYPPGAQPVKNAKINHDYKFAFVDVETDEDCLRAAERLNGMLVGPCSIKIQKAKGSGQMFAAPGFGTVPISTSLPPGLVPVLPGAGFVPVAAFPNPPGGVPAPPAAPAPPSGSSSSVRSPFVLLTNISPAISEQDTRELVEPFGTLQGFNIIVTAGGSSRTAVFEYESADVAAAAAQALSTLVIAGLKLSALLIPQAQAELLMRPVSPRPGPSPVLGASSLPPPPPPPPQAAVAPGCSPEQALALEQRGGRCLVLSNMVGPEDLESDESCQDLIEDVAEECGKHGEVLVVKVPRSAEETEGKNQGSSGLVYVKFSSHQGAAAAKAAVHGKRFAGKAVAVGFFPVELFDEGTFAVPPGWSGIQGE